MEIDFSLQISHWAHGALKHEDELITFLLKEMAHRMEMSLFLMEMGL